MSEQAVRMSAFSSDASAFKGIKEVIPYNPLMHPINHTL